MLLRYTLCSPELEGETENIWNEARQRYLKLGDSRRH